MYKMKKIFLAILLLATYSSFAQFPNTHSQSNDRTLESFGGAITGIKGFVNARYSDTTSANSSPISGVSGGQIIVGDTVYIRNITTTKWIAIGTNTGGVSLSDTTLVQLPLFVDTSLIAGKKVLRILHDDGLASGGIVTWSGVGLTYYVTSAIYYIGGVQYVSPATTVTLDSADATYSTQYLFVVDTSATASFVRGTPAMLPLAPQPILGVQIALTSGITINAGATTPSTNFILFYNENLGEPTEATYGDNGGMVSDRDNTDNPFVGAKADYVSSYSNSRFYWADDSDIVPSGSDVINFHIYLNGAFSNQLFIALFDGASIASDYVRVTPAYGFNQVDSNNYQNISIPLSAFNVSRATYNTIAFELVGSDLTGAKGFYVDYVNIQVGSGVATGTLIPGGPFTSSNVQTGFNPGNNLTFAQLVNKVWYGTQAPTATLTGGINLEYNNGTVTSRTLSWSGGRLSNTPVLSTIVVNGISQAFSQPAQGASVSGTQSVSVPANTTTTYSNVVTASDGQTSTATTTFTFSPRKYYGWISDTTGIASGGQDAVIKALTSTLSNSKNLGSNVTPYNTGNPSGTQFFVYAFPSFLGSISSITFNGLPADLAMTTISKSITTTNGYTGTYTVIFNKQGQTASSDVIFQ